MRNIVATLLVLGAFVFLVPATVRANSIFTTIGFSGPSSVMSLQPFDHTLGTLTSVDVTIAGAVIATVDTAPSLFPMAFGVGVSQNFFPIPSKAFFTFFQPATFFFTGVGSGAPQVFTVPFNYGFTLNSATDLIGMAPIGGPGPAVPPVEVEGTLNGFTDTFFPLMMEFTETIPGGGLPSFGGASVEPGAIASTGTIFVQYNYTPSTAPVPEPSSIFLLGTGLLGLMVLTWRNKLFA